jgi:hypothetical protein
MTLRVMVIVSAMLASAHVSAETCNVHDAVQAEQETYNRQMARCSLDAVTYVDEHPLPTGLTRDQVYTLTATTLARRIDLCLQAAGYPRVRAATATDPHARVLKHWRHDSVCQDKIEVLEGVIANVESFK